ncbi:MAG: nucleotidyltransferase domain-containing protein [Chloroflexota bacterium]
MGTRVIRELMSQLTEYLTGCSEVLAAYLYGSHAEGRASALSDIDIGVLIRDGLAKERLWQLEDAMAADLRCILHTDKVDLVVLNLAPLRGRYEVITKGEVLYSADDGARADFESHSLRRYWDFEKYLEEYDRCFLTRIKEALDETQRRQYQDTFAKVRAVHRRVKEAADSQFRAV